jgi:hypothetical protein
MSKQWPRLAAAALGFLWYIKMGGGPTLNPREHHWAFLRDWRQSLAGLAIFRDATLDVSSAGLLPALPYPVGTALGFTDSNPLSSRSC